MSEIAGYYAFPHLQTFDCDPKDLIEEKELGRGAYGAVYRVKHAPTGTIMAVKVRGQQLTSQQV